MRRYIIAILFLLPVLAHSEEQTRSAEGYDSIYVKGPINLEIQAGKAHSLKLSGDGAYFSRIVTTVNDGRLNISFVRENKSVELKNLPRIVITLPELRKLVEEGAGETVLSNIDSKHLDINYKGAGRLAASGKVKHLVLEARGVGEVDAKELIAEQADVKFEGIGDVKIHANRRLDVSVSGMGDFTYYGNPRVLNKSVSGFGNIKAGD
jgi:hypothetical protein